MLFKVLSMGGRKMRSDVYRCLDWPAERGFRALLATRLRHPTVGHVPMPRCPSCELAVSLTKRTSVAYANQPDSLGTVRSVSSGWCPRQFGTAASGPNGHAVMRLDRGKASRDQVLRSQRCLLQPLVGQSGQVTNLHVERVGDDSKCTLFVTTG